MKKGSKNKKIILIVYGIILALVIWIFVIPFSYKSIEVYNVQEPYNDQEAYTDYIPNQICTHRSFWTGACDVWSTEYEPVTRYRTITKYQTVQKEREVVKKATLFNIWTGRAK